MEQKTVEQIAKDTYPVNDLNSDLNIINAQREAFVDGYTAAQQSQPMWREIEGTERYYKVIATADLSTPVFFHEIGGRYLLDDGYTHYLSSDDLLKLPTLTKTTPQERG